MTKRIDLTDMLTPEQQLQAKKEGWKIVGGYVGRAYSSHGQCPFNTVEQIVSFIREKGKTSDWHRAVYLALPWNKADDDMAHAEGWRLAYNEILLRSTARFDTNEAAQAFVQKGIESDDPLHIKTISTLAKRRLLYGDQ